MPKPIDLAELDELLRRGAVLVDVLPAPIYAQEHLPDAVSRPLVTMDAAAVADLDHDKPVVVYCFDYQCDLSPRAAARLTQLGFADVYDFVAGRAAWTADGRPTKGTVGDRDRILPCVRRDVPVLAPTDSAEDGRAAIRDWELCVVVDPDDIVLGVVRADALRQAGHHTLDALLVPGTGTVRPDARVTDMAEQLAHDHLDHVLVTTFAGHLVGLLRARDLDDGR